MGKNRDMSQFAKLGLGERLSFAFGDFGFNFVYGAVSTLYAIYMTDYIGISAYWAGLIVLLSRFLDGVTDVICGHLTKKTKSAKWGRMRPWLLVCTVPFMVTFVLLFAVPDFSTTAKIAYCFVMYNINQAIFSTAINLPYGALGTLMTRDQRERTILQTFRMVIAPLGSMAASAFSLPLVVRLGDDGAAWIKVTTVFAIIGAICLFVCAFNCKERVDTEDEDQQESALGFISSLKLLVKNYYWWIGLILWGSMNYIFAASSTAVSYYATWVVENTDVVMACQIIERVSLVVFISMMPFLIKRTGKKKLIVLGSIIVIVGQLLMLLADNSVFWLYFNSFTRGMGVAGIQGCTFIVIADAAEYAYWRDGIRQDGMIYSCGSIGAKVGPGVGTAFTTTILGFYGYDGTAVAQTTQALEGIRLSLIIPPIAVCILVLVAMIPYKLDKLYPRIERELAEREGRIAEQ